METEDQSDQSTQQLSTPKSFPVTAAVITGTLSVATDDDATGQMALNGFQYFLALEFAKQQPALSLLYELNFEVTTAYIGSRNYDFKILVTLKKRVKDQIQKAGAVTMLSLALGIPGVVLDSLQLYDYLFPPVKAELNATCPQAPVDIRNLEVRAPDVPDEEKPLPGGGKFKWT